MGFEIKIAVIKGIELFFVLYFVSRDDINQNKIDFNSQQKINHAFHKN